MLPIDYPEPVWLGFQACSIAVHSDTEGSDLSDVSIAMELYQGKSQDAGKAHVPHGKSDRVWKSEDSQNPLVVNDDSS